MFAAALSIATLATAVYAGYVHSPLYGAIICALTLVTTIAAYDLQAQPSANISRSVKRAVVALGPICFAACFGAYAIGHLARTIFAS